jgi:hypothetical protein
VIRNIVIHDLITRRQVPTCHQNDVGVSIERGIVHLTGNRLGQNVTIFYEMGLKIKNRNLNYSQVLLG